jgi:hypothetical protein
VFLDQILRRQEEYTKSLGPIKKLVKEKPLRLKKAPPILKVVPVYVPDEPAIALEAEIDSAPIYELAEIEAAPIYELAEIEAAFVAAIEAESVPEVVETVQELSLLEPVLPLPEQELSLLEPQLISACTEPTAAELEEIEKLESGTFELDEAPSPNIAFDLVSIFDKYVPKSKGAKMTHKMVGLPVPLDVHARMLKFMTANKDKPGAPKSLKDFGLMCVGYTLDSLELPQTDDEIQ